jgi:hypothetical protein
MVGQLEVPKGAGLLVKRGWGCMVETSQETSLEGRWAQPPEARVVGWCCHGRAAGGAQGGWISSWREEEAGREGSRKLLGAGTPVGMGCR